MFFVLGFLPCYLVGALLKKLGVLRIPVAIELAGMDHRIEQQELDDARQIVEFEKAEAASVKGASA